MMIEDDAFLIVIGTAAGTGQGGISTALPGYLLAIRRTGIPHQFVTSHEDGTVLHKLWLFIKAMRVVIYLINKAKKQKKIPILYIHVGPWLSMLRKLSFVWIGKLLGGEVLCQVHSPSIDRYLNNKLGRLACRLFFSQMDRVLVLTEWWHHRLAGDMVKRLDIVPNPLPILFEQIAHQIRSQSGSIGLDTSINLLCMARLVQGKGVDLAIQALVHLPSEYRLTIAGEGAMRKELEDMVSMLGVAERVTFLGWVGGEGRLALFENHDVFLLPSQNDSFGMGFIEAMAFGLPVVALNWGAIADVVPNDKAGILIEQPDALLLAQALKLLDSAERRNEMGAYGKQWVLQQFSIDSISVKLGNVVKKILGAE